jgi:Polysaccharide lyase
VEGAFEVATKPLGRREHDPPVQLHMNDSATMTLLLTDISGSEQPQPLGAIDRGKWHDFSAEIFWSSDPNRGYVSIAVDGKTPLTVVGATMHPNNPTVYWKLGLYRRKLAGSGTAILYHDEAARFVAPRIVELLAQFRIWITKLFRRL